MNIFNRIVGGIVGAVTGCMSEALRTGYRYAKHSIQKINRIPYAGSFLVVGAVLGMIPVFPVNLVGGVYNGSGYANRDPRIHKRCCHRA